MGGINWTAASINFEDRSIGTYAATISGMTGSTEEAKREEFFRRAVVENRKGAWSNAYRARECISWVFAGVGLPFATD